MAGKFLCPRCFELQSLDSIEYICSNTSTTSKCQHAIDRMPQHPANANHEGQPYEGKNVVDPVMWLLQQADSSIKAE